MGWQEHASAENPQKEGNRAVTTVRDDLATVAAYADRLAESETLADVGSMAAARALAELYESGEWVEEWNTERPIIERKGRGRPADPKGRNRFAQWVRWRLDQQGRSLQTRQTYYLLNADDMAGIVCTAVQRNQVGSAKALNPLGWLRKNRLADRAPEVWERAVTLAGGNPSHVTSEDVRQALAEWKRDVLGDRGVKAVTAHSRAEVKRQRAQDDLRALWALADEEEVRKFDDWYRKFRKGAAT